MPWKYQWVVDLMNEIIAADEYNDTYGKKDVSSLKNESTQRSKVTM